MSLSGAAHVNPETTNVYSSTIRKSFCSRPEFPGPSDTSSDITCATSDPMWELWYVPRMM